MRDPIRFSMSGGVAMLTFDRPKTRNTVTDVDFVRAFEVHCAEAQGNPSVAVVMLTGAGSAFSSGGNLKDMRARRGMFAGDAVALRENYRTIVQRITRTLYELEIPTIAVVNGPAMGAGCDIALACDIRIASEKACFAQNFVRLGLISGDGGAWFLPRIVGLSRAYEMAFTGDTIDANTALAYGLVSRVVPNDELMSNALALAKRIARHPPATLRITKCLIREGLRCQLDTLLELSASMQAVLHHSPEFASRIAATSGPRR